MRPLNGRVAIITGAGRRGGIGEAVARRLARDGAHVVVADLCAPPTDLPHGGSGEWDEMVSLAGEIQGMGVRCLPLRVDVTDGTLVERMVARVGDEFGRLDILVNNAGTAIDPSPVLMMSEEAWRRTLEINATGTFLCCKHAVPLMLGTQQADPPPAWGGRIVNMSSLAAARPRIFMSAYAASKAAVVALTQSLAQEVAQLGITVNAILPGDIDTAFKQWGLRLESWATGHPYEDVRAQIVDRIPVGRIGAPEDVAAMVAYLVSEEASFVTGQALNLTGGRELA